MFGTQKKGCKCPIEDAYQGNTDVQEIHVLSFPPSLTHWNGKQRVGWNGREDVKHL